MMKDSRDKLSKTSIFLHWLIGLAMIIMVFIGWYMETYEEFYLYGIHKSIGAILFVFIVVRIIWRYKNGWPKPLTIQKPLERIVAKLTHWTLLLSTLLFPVSGIMMNVGGGRGLYVFGLELIVANINPDTGKRMALDKGLSSLGHQVHGILMWVIIVAVALHIIGVIKHQYWYKDRTIKRMLNR